MTDGTDPAYAGSDARHFVIRTALGEFFETAHLGHVELGIGDLAFVVEVNSNLAVSFDSAHRFDGNATHACSLSELHGDIDLGPAPFQQVSDYRHDAFGRRWTAR